MLHKSVVILIISLGIQICQASTVTIKEQREAFLRSEKMIAKNDVQTIEKICRGCGNTHYIPI